MATGGYSPLEEGSFGEEDEGKKAEEEEEIGEKPYSSKCCHCGHKQTLSCAKCGRQSFKHIFLPFLWEEDKGKKEEREEETGEKPYSSKCCHCGHKQTLSCAKCQRQSFKHIIAVREARNVTLADTVYASDLDFGDEKETCALMMSPRGGLKVDKVSTLIIANNVVTLSLGSKDKVKVAVASDPQELKTAQGNVFILKTDWSSVSEKPDSSSQDKEVILTQIILKGAQDLFDQVLNLIQHAELPQEVIQNLYNKFRLCLLGLTKDLQILLEGSAEQIKNLSVSQHRDIQQELSRFVPEDQRHQLTWGFSRHPVQRSDRGKDTPRPGGPDNWYPARHRGDQESMCTLV